MVCIGPYCTWASTVWKGYRDCVEAHIQVCEHHPFWMGTFHIIITFRAIIGKWFQDAGLRDTCIESGIIAEGSVFGVLTGRMYSRAVRGHKMMRLYFISPGKVSLSSPPKPDALSQCIA